MNWKKEPLGKICKTTSGGTPSRKNQSYYQNGTIPWVKSGELENNIITTSEEFITEEGLLNSSAKIFPAGTLLIALYGATIGKLAFLGIDAATNQAVCGIFQNENVSLKYLYYYLLFQRPNLIKQGVGGAQPNISQTILKKLEISYPDSITEQQCIVARIEELFSELDKAVDTLKTTKEQMDVYRQAVLKKAFESKANASKAKLSSIGEICLGRQCSPKNISNEYPTKYIRAANITENGLKLDDILEMEFTPSERKKYYLKSGDIVVSEASGSAKQVGKPAIWKNEISKCCFQNTVIRLRLTADYSDYVFWYLKYLYLSGKIAKLVGGVGINHLGAKKFSDIEIPIIDLTAQLNMVQTIEKKMSQCDSVCKTIDTALAQADAMRQSILKQAFEEGIV